MGHLISQDPMGFLRSAFSGGAIHAGNDPGTVTNQAALDLLTANAPGAAPDAFSSVVSSAAKSRMTRVGMGRAQTFLSGLPGLGDIGSVGGARSGSGSSALGTILENRELRIGARSSRMPRSSLLGELL